MDRKIISSRIKKIRKAYQDGEYTQDDFAKFLGIPPTTYKSMEAGRAPLTTEKIHIFKEKVNVSPTWLLYGEGAMFLTDASIKDTFIPYYDDIRASAGMGATNGNVQEPEYIHLPKVLISDCSRVHTEAIKCSGDSMDPSIRDGDIMFIDRSETEIKDGEVYVVRFGDDLFVKRLYKMPGGKIVARSDNDRYPEFNLTNEPFEILGHVIYRMERV